MKEYGNYYQKEDVAIPYGNYIAEGVERAKLKSSPYDKHLAIRYNVRTLVHEAKERGDLKMGIEKMGEQLYLFYAFFIYNGRAYYWWELFRHNNFSIIEQRIGKYDSMGGHGLEILWSLNELYDKAFFVRSGLEFPIRRYPPVTYVWFATDSRQSPLMCTEQFKDKLLFC